MSISPDAAVRFAVLVPVKPPALGKSRLAGLPEGLIRDILALDDTPNRGHRLIEALPAYLSASEALWAFVDAWRSPS